jgi:hypothetical protein
MPAQSGPAEPQAAKFPAMKGRDAPERGDIITSNWASREGISSIDAYTQAGASRHCAALAALAGIGRAFYGRDVIQMGEHGLWASSFLWKKRQPVGASRP